jgi:6-pyruvoyltetrahydropterin/6-carboxytetrahydropterin synthase
MALSITRRATFAAAHRLYRADWDDARNYATFGPCSNPGGHGHNYVLEVTVGGALDPTTGMIADLKWVKAIMQREILDHVDHRNLNTQVDFLAGLNPTVEQLAFAFWQRLRAPISDHARLVRVTLHETENNVATYEDDGWSPRG